MGVLHRASSTNTLIFSSMATIIFYDPARGYGYLRLHGTYEEFHFRRANLKAGPVAKGDLVRFVLREGKQGYFADEVEIAMA